MARRIGIFGGVNTRQGDYSGKSAGEGEPPSSTGESAIFSTIKPVSRSTIYPVRRDDLGDGDRIGG